MTPGIRATTGDSTSIQTSPHAKWAKQAEDQAEEAEAEAED